MFVYEKVTLIQIYQKKILRSTKYYYFSRSPQLFRLCSTHAKEAFAWSLFLWTTLRVEGRVEWIPSRDS